MILCLQLGRLFEVRRIVCFQVLSSLKYLLGLYLVSLQVLQGLYVPLIQGQDHVLISILDLAEAFEDLNDYVRDVFIVLQGQSDNFFSADHIELVHTTLAHLSFQVVVVDLLSFGDFFLRALLTHAVLTFG